MRVSTSRRQRARLWQRHSPARWCARGYNRLRGYYIIIRHEGSVQTLYQHLSYIFVRGGETVTQGQTVAAVGSTGLVTGPHLHLEIILDGVRVDPMPSFPQLAA